MKVSKPAGTGVAVGKRRRGLGDGGGFQLATQPPTGLLKTNSHNLTWATQTPQYPIAGLEVNSGTTKVKYILNVTFKFMKDISASVKDEWAV